MPARTKDEKNKGTKTRKVANRRVATGHRIIDDRMENIIKGRRIGDNLR